MCSRIVPSSSDLVSITNVEFEPIGKLVSPESASPMLNHRVLDIPEANSALEFEVSSNVSFEDL